MLAAVAVSALISPAVVAEAPPAAALESGWAWETGIHLQGELTARPDGGVAVNEDHGSGGVPAVDNPSFVGITAFGGFDWRVDYASGDLSPMPPVVDRNGVVYRWQYNSNQNDHGKIIASGTPGWSTPAPGSPGQLLQLVVATNGNVYTLADNALYQFSATTGDPVFAQPKPVPAVLGSSFNQLYAYNNGLVAYNGYAIQYLDLAGNLISPAVTLPDFAFQFPQFGHLPVAFNGDVFTADFSASNGGSCAASIITVSKFTSAGRQWANPLPVPYNCIVPAGRGHLAATPDGGAVVTWAETDGGTLVQKVTAQGAPGTPQRLSIPAGQTLQSSLRPRVDAQGQIVVPEEFRIANCALAAYTYCLTSRLTRIKPDGSTDQRTLGSLNPIPPQLDSWSLWEGDSTSGLVLTPGQAIASTVHATLPDPSHPTYLVQASPFEGLAAEYPQSNIWAAALPPQSGGPNLTEVTPLPPSVSDSILTRNFRIVATPGESGAIVTSIEYAWVKPPGQPTLITPDGRSAYSGATIVPISYRAAGPNAVWDLYVRAIDSSGAVSSWTTVHISSTPSAPALIALGDSITAGHHKDSATQTTICQDATYSYPHYLYSAMQSTLPPQWQDGGYYNFAKSGYSTTAVLRGNSNDACGLGYPAQHTPINDVALTLAQRPDSWNRVVITAGINNTNWVDVLTDLYLTQKETKKKPINEDKCRSIVKKWDLLKSKTLAAALRRDVGEIASSVSMADSTSMLVWLGYYNAAGSGFAPSACDAAFAEAASKLNATIRQALNQRQQLDPSYLYTWVDTDTVMHLHPERFQAWTAVDWLSPVSKQPPGWPHPNSDGNEAIASLMR